MRGGALLLPALFSTWLLSAQSPQRSDGEARVARTFAAAAGDPSRLQALLLRMPKGADLHMHFSGAVYAETLLAEARADLLCVDPAANALVTNIGTTRSIPPQPVCGEGKIRVDSAFTNQALYDALINSFSMRSFVPRAGWSGHDQFFATFDRFDPTHSAGARHGGEWLEEVASRAAAQNEQYLEIMHTPDLHGALALAEAVPWPDGTAQPAAFQQDVAGTEVAQLTAVRQAMLRDAAFEPSLAADRGEFEKILADRRALEHCGEVGARAGCGVETRFLFQVLRAMPPSAVFAQALLGFELVQRESVQGAGKAMVLGVNFVQPEDNRITMGEYTRQMRMVGFLHQLYPAVHIALHAGELAEGLVPPEGLRFHIRQAVEIAHAERIGHGVDVAGEDGAEELLQKMAHRHVMTEINLTSNDVILNVTGTRHPLPFYRAAGVPVALSTDDEGVSRIDLTHEYLRAAIDFHLTYPELKRMVRTSLEHSFLPGASLWRKPDEFTLTAAPCSGTARGSEPASGSCQAFLEGSRRASAQWELERRFLRFEAEFR